MDRRVGVKDAAPEAGQGRLVRGPEKRPMQIGPKGGEGPAEGPVKLLLRAEEYGLMHVKLYGDIARHGQIATSYAYPVRVEGRYVMDPSPIPKFDNPKLSGNPAIQLFGAGREQRVYALPPWTNAVSLDFDDQPFQPSKAPIGAPCLPKVLPMRSRNVLLTIK